MEAKNHYGRDTFVTRLNKLKSDSIGRPYAIFEAGLNKAGTDVEQLQSWVADPDILEDEKVEPFMRSLAVIMSDMKVSLGEGKSLDMQASRDLQDQLSSLVKQYFD